jgi:hypothetical protein
MASSIVLLDGSNVTITSNIPSIILSDGFVYHTCFSNASTVPPPSLNNLNVTGTLATTNITNIVVTSGTAYPSTQIFNNGIWNNVTCTAISNYTLFNGSNNGVPLKKVKYNPKPIRSAIKKALKLITGLGYEEDARIFLSGSSLEISHPDSDLKFVITKYDNSILRGTKGDHYSSPFKVELYTKSNVFVSKLCVYIDQTPILDQMLGFIMFVRSGAEELLLEKANYPGLTSDMEVRDELSKKYPYLRNKLRPSTDTLRLIN